MNIKQNEQESLDFKKYELIFVYYVFMYVFDIFMCNKYFQMNKLL